MANLASFIGNIFIFRLFGTRILKGLIRSNMSRMFHARCHAYLNVSPCFSIHLDPSSSRFYCLITHLISFSNLPMAFCMHRFSQYRYTGICWTLLWILATENLTESTASNTSAEASTQPKIEEVGVSRNAASSSKIGDNGSSTDTSTSEGFEVIEATETTRKETTSCQDK